MQAQSKDRGPQSHRARDLGRAIDMNRDQASTKGTLKWIEGGSDSKKQWLKARKNLAKNFEDGIYIP